MKFFGNVINKIVNTYKQAYQAAKGVGNFFGASGPQPTPTTGTMPATTSTGQPVNFTIAYDPSPAIGSTQALMTIFTDRTLLASIYADIGQRAAEIIQDKLKPLYRTGGLERSWRYSVDISNNAVEVHSDHPAAASIQRGINRVGSYQNIAKWMDTKSEFDTLDSKEKLRVAYAIKRTIDSGKTSSGKSTLTSLSPSGERRYDYLTEAKNQLEAELEVMFNTIAASI